MDESDFDYFDNIQAPQFVDLNKIANNIQIPEDFEADKFFDTHKEEDDFVPLYKISPSIPQMDYSIISDFSINSEPNDTLKTPEPDTTKICIDDTKDQSHHSMSATALSSFEMVSLISTDEEDKENYYTPYATPCLNIHPPVQRPRDSIQAQLPPFLLDNLDSLLQNSKSENNSYSSLPEDLSINCKKIIEETCTVTTPLIKKLYDQKISAELEDNNATESETNSTKQFNLLEEQFDHKDYEKETTIMDDDNEYDTIAHTVQVQNEKSPNIFLPPLEDEDNALKTETPPRKQSNTEQLEQSIEYTQSINPQDEEVAEGEDDEINKSASKIPKLLAPLQNAPKLKFNQVVRKSDSIETSTARSRGRTKAPVKTSTDYVPLAEAIAQFFTTDRFDYNSVFTKKPRSASADSRKCVSKSPSPEKNNFARSGIRRSLREREDEYSKCNRKILKPNLMPALHHKLNQNHTQGNEYRFKAKPVPVKILLGTTGVNLPTQTTKVTSPINYNFASDQRIAERQKLRMLNEAVNKVVSTQSRPNTPASSRGPTPKKMCPPSPKITEVKPFSFEERDKDVKYKKERVLKEMEEEAKKAREFKAKPIPAFLTKQQLIPIKRPATATENNFTKCKPFNLMSDERGAEYKKQFANKLKEEEEREKAQRQFLANPPKILDQKAFEPHLEPKFTDPVGFQLSSEIRHHYRKAFDQTIKEREMQREEMEKLEEQERQEKEKELELLARSQIVFKANPFKVTRPFELKSTEKLLTVPCSPSFLSRERIKRTHSNNTSISSTSSSNN